MVPIRSVASCRDTTGPHRAMRCNLHPATEVPGSALPGLSTGTALTAIEGLAGQALPDGLGYDRIERADQEREAGNTAIVAFIAAVLLAFLVMAALYKGWPSPLAMVLVEPTCVLAALPGVSFRGTDNNILTQAGLVALIGLAATNAILFVEPARQAEERGRSRVDAATEAARVPTADRHDPPRLYPRRRAAHHRDRGGRGNALGARHDGVLRDARCGAVRAPVHAAVLSGLPLARRVAPAQSARAGPAPSRVRRVV